MKKLIFYFAILLTLILIAIIGSKEPSSNVKSVALVRYNEPFTVNTPTPKPTPSPTPTINPVEVAKKEVNEIENKIEKTLKNCSDSKTRNIKASKKVKKLFIKYKSALKKNSELLDPPETIYDCFSKEDIKYIHKAVETETHEQNIIAKVNVASTILSRFDNGKYGGSLKEIITSPRQFVYGRNNIDEETVLAVELAFMFKTKYGDSLYFQSAGYMEEFNGAKYMGFDGCHYFYK